MKPVLAVTGVAVLSLAGLLMLSRGAAIPAVPGAPVRVSALPSPSSAAAAAGKAADAAVDTAAKVARGVAKGAAEALTQAVASATSAASGGAVSDSGTTATGKTTQAGAQGQGQAQAQAETWSAAALSAGEIKQRIATADIAEADRVSLMAAFQQAHGTAEMQAVLDKLKLALEAARNKG